MDYQQITFILLVVLGYASYSAYKLKDQIWCTFRRKDRTKIEKFAKQGQAKIDFDGGYYNVNPRKTTLILWTKGIHLLVPTWVRSLDYRHDSSEPLNPDTFENSYDTPEAKRNLDKTHAIQQFFAGNRQAMGGKIKLGRLQEYMPLLMIGGLVVMAYFLWNQQQSLDMIGKGQNALQALIGQMLKK